MKRSMMTASIAVLSLGVTFASLSQVKAADAPSQTAATLQSPLRALVDYWVAGRLEADEHKTVLLQPTLNHGVVAKAEKEECFAGIGQPYPQRENGSCPAGSVDKSNQSYVWGLTQVNDRELWFGTVANTLCMRSNAMGGDPEIHEGYWVCEVNQATSGTGDFRAPKIYRYDVRTETLQDKTPSGGDAGALIADTVGLRSAGNFKGVVFLAGPNLAYTAIHIFAYDATTGELLGAREIPQFNDIRSWLVTDNALFAGVANSGASDPSQPGGFVIKWTGLKSSNPDELFKFDVVGVLDGEAANLTLHNGRIYVSTWPNLQGGAMPSIGNIRYSGVYESPLLRNGRLGEEDATGWNKVWSVTDYEPDMIAAILTMGGALQSYNGSLYWGTMVMPEVGGYVAAMLHQMGMINLDANGNGQLDTQEMLNAQLGTHRPISLFKGFGRTRRDQGIQMLYGEKYLPTYDPSVKAYTVATDPSHLNRMGLSPVWGASGYGNLFNTYTWSMARFAGSLFIGTFDWSQTFRVRTMDMLETIIHPPTAEARASMQQQVDAVWNGLQSSVPSEGADLFRIDDASGKARAETLDGFGNTTNYGFRTLSPTRRELYLGTANGMNIHPRGGWELIEAD